MKKKNKYFLKKLFLFFACAPLLVFSQVTNEQTQLQKLEATVNTAKAKHAANERKLEVADSFINTGNQMVTEAEEEFDAIEKERKSLDKSFNTNVKPLAKLQKSKDKAEAAKAKTDFKTLETQYKADVKAMDTRLKTCNKKGEKGYANIAKGKEAKKATLSALKDSQAVLDAAMEKYDAAANPPEESDGKDL